MSNIADRGVYFDEDFRIRILEVEKYSQSKTLQDNCGIFVSNVQQLQDVVAKYVQAIDSQVDKIEAEKLKAVGLRNKVAALNEERKNKQKQHEQLVSERQEELERLQIEEQSLIKVKQEQELLILKLSESSTGAAYNN